VERQIRQRVLWACVIWAVTLAPVAFAQAFRVLKSFEGTNGSYPDGDQPCGEVVLSGNTLYGTTRYGGTPGLGLGVVFRMNTDGSDFRVLVNGNNYPGEYPQNGVVLAGSTLYGTAGGPSAASDRYGLVFRVETNGSALTVLRYFDGTNASGATGLVLQGSTIYGVAEGGSHPLWPGFPGVGVVFRMNTDGTGFTVLKDFSPIEGIHPLDLVLAGNTLYGATSGGGASTPDGVVFKINTNGSGFTILKDFTNPIDGAGPAAGLLLSGNSLYGTAQEGGSSNNGVVFKINTDGSGYSVLKSFSGSDGMSPRGRLTLSGNTLFGTTYTGGSSNCGVVFKINTNGSGYAVLQNFTSEQGSFPLAGLVLAGNVLYGTTAFGPGADGHGTVFSLECLSLTTPPLTQTAEIGSTVQFQVGASSPAPGLGYQWFFAGTNAVPGATTSVLELTNVQAAQAGAYSVVVTNMGLAVTSPPALLSVIPRVERRVVPALNLTSGNWNALHVEYADDFSSQQWSPLSDVALSGGQQFCFDVSPQLPECRFYRAWQTNGPPSSLEASLVTEITLTGPVGSSVRVDYINATGPVDAWITLNTVTLTNTTQSYYDMTSFRQPARLYCLTNVP